MPDFTPPSLNPKLGERLVRAEYKYDFRQQRADSRGRDHFKLERIQHFEETDHAGREALRRGNWEEALRLMEERRPALAAAAEADARRDAVFRRVRIVEEPLTPYMQWQLHSLRLRDECGVRVRVVTADRLTEAEVHGRLPELVVIGGRTLYRVLYTDAGVPDGAIRFTDPGTVAEWESYIRQIYQAGEDVQEYFRRQVAHLPAPVPV